MGAIQQKNKEVERIESDLLLVAPISWSVIRTQEIYFLSKVRYESPMLDLACGDGSFAKVLTNHISVKQFDVGLDFDESELKKARKLAIYKKVVRANASSLPFKNNHFQTIFSNGSVEHFDNFDECLSEIARVLKKHGRCYLTVPTKYIGEYLFFVKLLKTLRLGIFADLYEKTFNDLFKHKNLYSHNEWEKILRKHNLNVENFFYYNLDKVLPTHEIFLWFSLWNVLLKKITGFWILNRSMRKYTMIPEQHLLRRLASLRTSKTDGPSLFLEIKKI